MRENTNTSATPIVSVGFNDCEGTGPPHWSVNIDNECQFFVMIKKVSVDCVDSSATV